MADRPITSAGASPRRVLLVGGSGFIGRNLAQVLADRGHRVWITDPRAADAADPQVIPLALTDRARLQELLAGHAIDTVVHLACTLLPSSPAAQFEREMSEVLLPSFALMDHCAQASIPFVLFSSGGTVYGESEAARAHEQLPLTPRSRYGLAKLMLEEHARLCHRTLGLQHLVLRPSNPYGRHQRLDGSQGIVAVALGRALAGVPLEIWGDGETVRDYLDVRDLCDAVTVLLERRVVNTTLNIGSGVGHSVNEVIDLVRRVSGRELTVLRRDARAVDVRRIVLDTRALASLIDWRPRPLCEGVAQFHRELAAGAGRAR